MDIANFSERLSELIADANVNLTELSKKIGCGESTISHYVTGRYYPTLEMTVRLADYFRCTTDYLLGITEDNRVQNFNSLLPPFGERLLLLCKTHGITRYRLRKMTDISESTMRYWIRGKTQPSVVNVMKIAEKLNCTVDYLIGREN